ncbi:MAG: molybdenum cofactor biosynthesis protein MoaE [Saprospiraceae bacterium]|nr:molybdenum cofactor biosynthesis protein MoaE [Saprospiraceae bacterium]
MENISIHLTTDPPSIDEAFDFINDGHYGGNCLFIGTVRHTTGDRKTVALDFESFEPMAIKEMKKIAERTLKQFGPGRCYMIHKTGKAVPGEIVVVIAISTAHRKSAFKATEMAIDQLKESVPIWKKEILQDGSFWVNAHP